MEQKSKCVKCWIQTENGYDFCDKHFHEYKDASPRDYQTMSNKDTPPEIRKKFDIWDIRDNSIKCKKCGDIIRSKNRHNMVWCSCGSVSIDWGSRYTKISWYKDAEVMTVLYDKLHNDE